MSSIFSRLNQELESFGRRAQSVLDEGKLQIELLRLRRQRDNAAKDLGMIFYQQQRGTAPDQRRVYALVQRIDDLEEKIAAVERQQATAKAEVVSVSETPAPPSAAPAEAEVTEEKPAT